MRSETTPELTASELRRFGLLTGGTIAILFGLLLPWIRETAFPTWPWGTAAVLTVWALAAPKTLRGVYRAWMQIGAALGYVNSRIILFLVYFLIFTPIAAVMRLTGWDPLSLRTKPTLTYRKPSEKTPSDRMEKPY